MIQLIKLVSGEEVLADMEATEDENMVLLKTPSRVMPVQTAEGFGMQIVPFSLFTQSEDITISKNHIMFHEEPQQEIKEQYCKMTSKIIAPSNGILLP